MFFRGGRVTGVTQKGCQNHENLEKGNLNRYDPNSKVCVIIRGKGISITMIRVLKFNLCGKGRQVKAIKYMYININLKSTEVRCDHGIKCTDRGSKLH